MVKIVSIRPPTRWHTPNKKTLLYWIIMGSQRITFDAIIVVKQNGKPYRVHVSAFHRTQMRRGAHKSAEVRSISMA